MNRTIRISPSLLESYRLTQLGMYGKDGDSLERDVLGVREPSDAMSRGTAYHAIIERGAQPYINRDGWCSVQEPEAGRYWVFSPDAVAPALAVRSQHPAMIHELPVHMALQVGGYTVEMHMRFDGLDANHLHEFKTKSRAPEMMEYHDSLQWRCYLAAFGEIADVTYHIFQLNEKCDKCTYHRFTFNRVGDEADVVYQYLHGFIKWLETRPHLIDYLEQKAAAGRAQLFD